jgi:hypothetical protein
VLYAVNAIGRDDRHYTVMMVKGKGAVLARRWYTENEKRGKPFTVKSFVHPELRSEETLRYIAWLKGFVVI